MPPGGDQRLRLFNNLLPTDARTCGKSCSQHPAAPPPPHSPACGPVKWGERASGHSEPYITSSTSKKGLPVPEYLLSNHQHLWFWYDELRRVSLHQWDEILISIFHGRHFDMSQKEKHRFYDTMNNCWMPFRSFGFRAPVLFMQHHYLTGTLGHLLLMKINDAIINYIEFFTIYCEISAIVTCTFSPMK